MCVGIIGSVFLQTENTDSEVHRCAQWRHKSQKFLEIYNRYEFGLSRRNFSFIRSRTRGVIMLGGADSGTSPTTKNRAHFYTVHWNAVCNWVYK